MKILTIGPANTPHLIRPVRSLLKKGHQVCLVGYHSGDPLAKESWPNYSWFADPGGGDSPVSAEAAYKSYEHLNALLTAYKPDIIHVHWISWHLGSIRQLAPKIPLVVSVWGTDINHALTVDDNDRYIWRSDADYNARDLPLADYLIVDDPTMIDKCAFVAPKVPVRLLTLGADKDFFEKDPTGGQRIRKRLSLPHKHIFTSCRLLNPNYRQEAILQAFARVARNEDAVLIFKKFISIKESLQPLKNLANDLGIANQVRFYGTLSTEDLRDLYSISKALISFPQRDAFPVTFAEAAASGARVITCWHPAYNVPLVKNYFDVLDNDSIDSLASAIKRAMSEPFPKSRLEAARKLAKEEYSHEKYINGLEDIYTSFKNISCN